MSTTVTSALPAGSRSSVRAAVRASGNASVAVASPPAIQWISPSVRSTLMPVSPSRPAHRDERYLLACPPGFLTDAQAVGVEGRGVVALDERLG
ncbi:hypothetical protein [Streptomyces sp. NPDC048266]|uniref:hypothetical protein n=1 Tax=Streptomyces sp. NPDC048266 TaxID=3155787 RepID=UPI0034005806